MQGRLEQEGKLRNDASSSWRDQLSLQVVRASAAMYAIACVVVPTMTRPSSARTTLTATALFSLTLVGVSAVTGRPTGKPRAWLIVCPSVLCSLVGYAMVGFLSGPAVVLTLTLVLAGLLLGNRVMLILSALIAVGLGCIAWAMIHGLIPTPNPSDVSMARATAWVRTLTVTFLSIGLLGTLMIGLVSRLEQSLTQARTETLLREQAERAKAEAEIHSLEARQLETIGRLAAGIAHDFNNNLTAILGCAELLKDECGNSGPASELVEDILKSSNRAADLTRQLLAYSRKAQMELVNTDIHGLLRSAVTLLRRSVDPRVRIVTQLNAENAVVLADVTLLENALLNMLVNAGDAMPDGGQLTIATTQFEVGEGSHYRQRGVSPGQHVLIEIIDTGLGIAPENLPRVFDPFFTTKPVGKGTGLGLAAVSGTIKAHNGSIDVDSEPQSGSAFRILLPCAPSQAISSRLDTVGVVRGAGEILLIDDDPAVSKAATRTLQNLGYRVTPAADGAVALELLAANPGRYDLAVLDLRMPKLSGEETFDGLRRISPALPILIWSGYGAEHEVSSMLSKGAAGFIQKPYQIGELSRVVAQAVRSESRRIVEERIA